MTFTLVDFLIGFFLMNAMPHLVFGQTRTRFLSAFGYSPAGNVAYAFLNITVALVLFHVQYGLAELTKAGWMMGALALFVIYVVTGRYFYQMFQQD